MPAASEIRVSIDVGCHSHSVAIGLSTGEVLEKFDLQHRPEGFDLFFARVERCQRRYGGEVAVARAYLSGQHMMAAIARHFGVHYSTVSRMVRAHEESMAGGCVIARPLCSARDRSRSKIWLEVRLVSTSQVESR